MSPKVKAFFHMVAESKVGNGEQTLFWKYRWIMGQFMLNLPKSIKNHPKKNIKQRTIAQALANRSWISDINGALLVQVIREYMFLWDFLDDVTLQHRVEDQHIWKLDKSRHYSSKSTYSSFF